MVRSMAGSGSSSDSGRTPAAGADRHQSAPIYRLAETGMYCSGSNFHHCRYFPLSWLDGHCRDDQLRVDSTMDGITMTGAEKTGIIGIMDLLV